MSPLKNLLPLLSLCFYQNCLNGADDVKSSEAAKPVIVGDTGSATEQAALLALVQKIAPMRLSFALVEGAIATGDPEILELTLRGYPQLVVSSGVGPSACSLLTKVLRSGPDDPKLLEPLFALGVPLDEVAPPAQTTPLIKAINWKKPNQARAIVERGRTARQPLRLAYNSPEDGTALYSATRLHQVAIVDELCKDPDMRVFINTPEPRKGNTPLMAAAWAPRHFFSAECLTPAGKKTVHANATHILTTLLRAGANPTIRNRAGKTVYDLEQIYQSETNYELPVRRLVAEIAGAAKPVAGGGSVTAGRISDELRAPLLATKPSKNKNQSCVVQ